MHKQQYDTSIINQIKSNQRNEKKKAKPLPNADRVVNRKRSHFITPALTYVRTEWESTNKQNNFDSITSFNQNAICRGKFYLIENILIFAFVCVFVCKNAIFSLDWIWIGRFMVVFKKLKNHSQYICITNKRMTQILSTVTWLQISSNSNSAFF